MAVMDDFATKLASLKQAYGTATQPDDVQKQAAQLRNEAYTSGINLGDLEDSANKIGGFKADTSPEEKAWRETTFNSAMTAKPIPQIPNTRPMDVAGNNNNTYIDDYNKLATQYKQLINSPFTFNAETDPTFQAAKQLAQTQGKLASKNALETMNDRGIINSSVTSNQLGQIEQAAQQKPLELIPQLQANAYNQHQQGISNLFGLMTNQMQMGLDQQKVPMQEAALTGKYTPPGMTDLINRILADKQGYGNDISTSTQKQNFTADAQAARDALSAKYGMNADAMFGSNVDYADAVKNASSAGQMTVAEQQVMMNALLNMGQTYGKMPTGAGAMVNGLPNYTGLGSIVTGLEGKTTTAQQNADANMIQAGKSGTSKTPSDQDLVKSNTQKYVNSLLATSKTEADALNYINIHKDELLKYDVSLPTLYAEVKKHWSTQKPSNGYTTQVWSAANEAAQNDPEYDFSDPTANTAIMNKYLDYYKSVMDGGQ